jgi:hypothetical protein
LERRQAPLSHRPRHQPLLLVLVRIVDCVLADRALDRGVG